MWVFFDNFVIRNYRINHFIPYSTTQNEKNPTHGTRHHVDRRCIGSDSQRQCRCPHHAAAHLRHRGTASSRTSAQSTSFYLQSHTDRPGSTEVSNGVRAFDVRNINKSIDPTTTPSRVVKRAGNNNATIYGYECADKDNTSLSAWVQLYGDGTVSSPIWTENWTFLSDIQFQSGFVVDGVLYAFGYNITYYDTACFMTFDVETGTMNRQVNTGRGGEDGFGEQVILATYDETTATAYVFTINSNGQDVDWCTINLTNGSLTRLATGLTWKPISMAIDPTTSMIYGINSNGQFGVVDKSTGAFRALNSTGISPWTTTQAMVYSPNDGGMVWQAVPYSTVAPNYRVVIEPSTGLIKEQIDLANDAQFSILYCPDKAAASTGAPTSATINGANFEGAALNGNINLTLPMVDIMGNSLSGVLTVNVYIDGSDTPFTSTGTPGQTIDVPVTVTEGTHTASVVIIDGTVEGNSSTISFYAGNDTPSAPANVKLTSTAITWDAVTTGVHQGYVDAAAVTYNVYLNGTQLNSTPVTDTKYALTISEDNIAANKAQVEAVFEGKTSERTGSNTYVAGAFSLPVEFSPTPAELEYFETTDGNDDGLTWEYVKDEYRNFTGVSGIHSPEDGNPADDWLLMPPIYFEPAPGEYELSYEVRVGSVYRGGSYDVRLCKDGEDITAGTALIAEDYYTYWWKAQDFSARSVKFELTEPGVYRIGFHNTSAYSTSDVTLRNIKVASTGVTFDAPGRCTDITATPAAYGKLNADVTLTLPSINVAGEPLEEGTEVTATVSSSVDTVSVTGTIGETKKVNIATVQGSNTLTIVTAIGSHTGMESSIDVYTGIDRPQCVDITKRVVSEDNMSVYFEWETSTVGANGGFVDPASLTYQVTWYDYANTFWWAETDGNYTGTEYTYTAKKPSIQALETVGVTPYSEAGCAIDADGNKGVTMFTAMLGKPYTLPMVEKFSADYTYSPILADYPSERYNADWYYNNPATANPEAAVSDAYCYIAASNYDDTYALLRLPKFSTEGKKAVYLTFRFYFDSFMPDVDICALTYDEQNQVIATINNTMGEGWQNVTVALPDDYLNYKWLEIDVRPYFASKNQILYFDGYNFREPVENDLGIEYFSGKEIFYANNEVTYTAEIDNYGMEAVAAPAPTLTLSVNGKTLTIEANEKSTKAMDSGDSRIFTFTVNASADFIGDGTLTLNVNSDDDYMANNTETVNVSVKNLNPFVVSDLSGTVDDDQNAILTWSAPAIPSGLEDFEDMSGFSYDDILGQWLNIDGDGYNVWGFSGVTFDGMGLAKGWQVIDYTKIADDYQSLFPTVSGTKAIMAVCPEAGWNSDDWLISPEVEGGSSVSFNIAVLNTEWVPETVEICASSTGREVQDFIVVSTVQARTLSYQKHTVTLPEDARYFALHYTSADKYGVLVDDIEYSPLAASWEVEGYNVYRDGAVIAESVNDIEYIDSHATTGIHSYNVATLVNNGSAVVEQDLSNTVSLTIDRSGLTDASVAQGTINGSRGAIIINGFQGKTFSVIAADGKTINAGRISNSRTVVPMSQGVYMVKIGTTVAKVIVK